MVFCEKTLKPLCVCYVFAKIVEKKKKYRAVSKRACISEKIIFERGVTLCVTVCNVRVR